MVELSNVVPCFGDIVHRKCHVGLQSTWFLFFLFPIFLSL